MTRRTKHKLGAVQLQHWIRAVETRKTPTIIDTETKQKRVVYLIKIILPFVSSAKTPKTC